MADPLRIRRQQLLREAEGHLELMSQFGDMWRLSLETRNVLGQRVIDTLERIPNPGGLRGQVLSLQGQALRHMDRFAEAIAPLREAAELEPQNVHIRLTLAWCQKRNRRLDLAIEALEEALDIDPTIAILHYNLACYWSLAGNPKLACGYLAQAFELDPSYRDHVASEHDFDPIRNHPNFLTLVSVIV